MHFPSLFSTWWEGEKKLVENLYLTTLTAALKKVFLSNMDYNFSWWISIMLLFTFLKAKLLFILKELNLYNIQEKTENVNS